MKNNKLGILPPWSIFIKKLEALFDEDPQIAFNVNWNGTSPSVVLATNNPEKAAALLKILPESKEFGNVTLDIFVDSPTISNTAFTSSKELFETAFYKNPVFKYAITPSGYWFVDFTYIVFSNKVVQIFADNINDPHGVISTLYQDIAKEVLDSEKLSYGVSYCTAIDDENVDENDTNLLGVSYFGSWDVNINTNVMPQNVASAFTKLNEMVGASYMSIAYIGSKKVNGINHAVLAEQTILTGKDTKNIVLIIFNEKPDDLNLPTVYSIERVIEGSEGFGGTNINVVMDIPKEAMDIWKASFEGYVGIKAEPKVLLATKITRGTNYVFLAELIPVTIDGTKKAAIVVVNDFFRSVTIEEVLDKSQLGYAFTW